MLIIDENEMSAGMARYWHCKAKKLANRIDVIDPWRLPIKTLKARGIKGKICAWIKGEILGKFINYKEKQRGIKPFYGNIGQIATSGFGNEVALHYFLKNR